MKKEFKIKSFEASLFWFEASSFFKDIGLLMESVANTLIILGYKPIRPYYNVPFSATPNDSRLVYDRVNMHWMGNFHDPDESMNSQQIQTIHYGYGLSFRDSHPQAHVDPWLPLFYFFKAKMVGTGVWEAGNWNKILFDPVALSKASTGGRRYLVYFEANQLTELTNNKVEQVTAVRIPLGALNSNEDVAKLVGPIVKALRNNDESSLAELGDHLIEAGEILFVDPGTQNNSDQ